MELGGVRGGRAVRGGGGRWCGEDRKGGPSLVLVGDSDGGLAVGSGCGALGRDLRAGP